MRLSNVERRRCGLLPSLLAALVPGAALAQLSTTIGPNRLVDVIQVDDRETQLDLTIIFNCSMRFVTNVPANEGREVHIQLVPLADCRVSPFAQIPSENPPISGGTNILASARVE